MEIVVTAIGGILIAVIIIGLVFWPFIYLVGARFNSYRDRLSPLYAPRTNHARIGYLIYVLFLATFVGAIFLFRLIPI